MREPPEDSSASLCQSCGRRPAVVEFIQITGDERRMFALCRECAVSHGLSVQVDAFQRLSQLLMHQMRPIGSTMPDEWQAAMDSSCSHCGLVFEEFVKTGLLGCSHCYKEFQVLLTPILRRLHGVTKQTADEAASSLPIIEKRLPDPNRELLEAELNLALSEENYERAAAIRDQLKQLGV